MVAVITRPLLPHSGLKPFTRRSLWRLLPAEPTFQVPFTPPGTLKCPPPVPPVPDGSGLAFFHWPQPFVYASCNCLCVLPDAIAILVLEEDYYYYYYYY